MLLTPHAVVGVAIGTLGSPYDKAWIIAPLAIASHFILDSIPHWDLDTEDLDKKDVFVVLLDLLLAIVFTWILASGNPNWEHMWIGAISATMPDSHHLIRTIFGDQRLQRYTNAHTRYHSDRGVRFLPGIALQMIFIMVAVLLIGR